ncbi:C40 family peptidase [Lacinutrix salivirga]
MKKTTLILLLLIFVSACKSTKNKRVVTKKARTSKRVIKAQSKSKTTTTYPTASSHAISDKIIKHAKKFKGTRYKYGGTTKSGMDCSGLIYTAFKKENIIMPRSTTSLKSYGDWVDLKEVREGDLLFFATKKNSRNVNHVGIVTTSRTGKVEFIHASTSRGVIISDLSEKYWYFAFVQARRVL